MIRPLLFLLALSGGASAQTVCGLGEGAALDALAGDWAARMTPEYVMVEGEIVDVLGDGATVLTRIDVSGSDAVLVVSFSGEESRVVLTPATDPAVFGPLPDVLTDTLAPERLAAISGCDVETLRRFDLAFTRDFPDGRSASLTGRLVQTDVAEATALQVITLYDPDRGTARLVSRFDLTR